MAVARGLLTRKGQLTEHVAQYRGALEVDPDLVVRVLTIGAYRAT